MAHSRAFLEDCIRLQGKCGTCMVEPAAQYVGALFASLPDSLDADDRSGLCSMVVSLLRPETTRGARSVLLSTLGAEPGGHGALLVHALIAELGTGAEAVLEEDLGRLCDALVVRHDNCTRKYDDDTDTFPEDLWNALPEELPEHWFNLRPAIATRILQDRIYPASPSKVCGLCWPVLRAVLCRDDADSGSRRGSTSLLSLRPAGVGPLFQVAGSGRRHPHIGEGVQGAG